VILMHVIEIQEIRHLNPSSTSSNPSRINTLQSTLDSSISSIEPRIQTVRDEASPMNSPGLSAAVEELIREWSDLADQHAMLKEEMKEDGWLVRFRA
jgi:hypothetical protein